MRAMRLRHVNKVKAKGRYYYYHRLTGNKIDADPSDPVAFQRAYNVAASNAPVSTETFDYLVTAFKASPEFKRTADRTRKEYNRYLENLRHEFGDMPIAALEDTRAIRDFMEYRNRFADKPRTADYIVQTARRLLNWSKKMGYIKFNILAQTEMLYESERSDIIWLPEHIERFMDKAYWELSVVVAFGIYLGQRESDILKLGPQHLQTVDGVQRIVFRQSKSKKTVRIPLHRDFKPLLASLGDDMVFLKSKTGKPWGGDHFRHEMLKYTRLAGLDQIINPEWGDDPVKLNFNDIRGTAVTMLAEEGCTVPEIADITGHSTDTAQKILDVYMARTGVLAMSAIRKLENASGTNSAKLLQNIAKRTKQKLAGEG